VLLSRRTPYRSTPIATTASMCFGIELDSGETMEMRLIPARAIQQSERS
jgi:hypothetical protein